MNGKKGACDAGLEIFAKLATILKIEPVELFMSPRFIGHRLLGPQRLYHGLISHFSRPVNKNGYRIAIGAKG